MQDDSAPRRAPPTSATSQTLLELILEVAPTFRQVAALGQKMGTRTERGAYLGLMRLLEEQGPLTVPQLARERQVSRQHVQTVVNELLERGWLELVENPSHKRSKLVRFTPLGVATFDDMTLRLQDWTEEKAKLFTTSEVRIARRVLKQIRDAISL